jgi:coenzyme F420 hydrogenase subunit beta
MSDIDKVISNGYCIGCGSCQVENNVKTQENDYGMYYPDIEDIGKLNSKVCPFSNNSSNEIQISNKLFKNIENIKFHKHIGHYLGLYAGYVKDNIIRKNATSGGITKWILYNLLKNKKIDGVIHVTRKKDSNKLFEYTIGTTKEDIFNGSHSAYYTNNFSVVMNTILNEKDDKKYAFIGVPCYCKSIRLLCEENPKIKNKISFVIGILCGHMKTKNYAKFMAWESKLEPNKLTYVNFRKKNNTRASDYIFHGKDNSKEVNVRRVSLQGGNYNIPHMKYKACDFCEDVFAYCADVVLGDAWLAKYINDPKGTNVVIVRNNYIYNLLKSEELKLDLLSETDIIKSQSSSYSHRIEEIGYRLYEESLKSDWLPNKMIKPVKKLKNSNRERIQQLRMAIREKSHEYFLEALNKNNLSIYIDKINNLKNELNSYY